MHQRSIQDCVKEAFLSVHAGRSTDDVIIDDGLNEQFLTQAKAAGATGSDFEINWVLLNLRKKSGLGPVVTCVLRHNHSAYVHASEIAARQVEDRHETTVDRILCDPKLRGEFDAIASSLTDDIPVYQLRKAALTLRKCRKLKPELIKRVANWDVSVLSYPAKALSDDNSLIPRQPGIYMFFDNSGYLYIGEAGSLRTRVAKHLDHSDRKALARHLWTEGLDDLQIELHIFAPDSDGRLAGHRRAYEASLIQSRQPRFNIQML
jgi:hypothetical protein